MLDDLITIHEAATKSGFSEIYLRKLCQGGKIKARKFGVTWVIDPSSLDKYMASNRKKGRPSLDK